MAYPATNEILGISIVNKSTDRLFKEIGHSSIKMELSMFAFVGATPPPSPILLLQSLTQPPTPPFRNSLEMSVISSFLPYKTRAFYAAS